MPRTTTAPPTIVSLKQEWLSTQTRLLSTDLEPSKSWRASNNDDNHQNENEQERPTTTTTISLPDKAIDDAIWALNHRVQQHAKRVYSRQATRHVAEQIDQLYWDASNRVVDRAEGDDGGEEDDDDDDDEFRGLSYGADLVSPKIIKALPQKWTYDQQSTRQSEAYPQEAARYTELVTTLKSLSSQKQEITSRVNRLRRMKSLLEPFDTSSSNTTNEDNGTGSNLKLLQDNLITRDGQIEKELQRMRMLLARVGGRVDKLQPQPQSQSQSQQQQQDKEKGKEGNAAKGKRKRNHNHRSDDGQSEDETNNRMVIDFGLNQTKKMDDVLKLL